MLSKVLKLLALPRFFGRFDKVHRVPPKYKSSTLKMIINPQKSEHLSLRLDHKSKSSEHFPKKEEDDDDDDDDDDECENLL